LKAINFAICFAAAGFSSSVAAQNTLDLEGAYVVPGYIDVAIPGNTGTRVSLTDDLDADATPAFRLRYGRTFAEKHWVAGLVAPLTVKSHGALPMSVDFNGAAFTQGMPVDATFRFDSYRLIYRYLFHKSKQWQFGFGGAVQVRDAAIKLQGGGLVSEKTNTGVVPLLSFNAAWTPNGNLQLLVEGEALAAPQGRAEDVLFAVQYDVNQRISLKGGYRVLEGGADNDEVYTFSLFHYLVAGVTVSF
jgi:hypothetical protein